MGGSSTSALVSTFCAAPLDRFQMVAGVEVHRDHHQQICFVTVANFLGIFAPVHAQEAQIRSSAHRVLPAALLLLEQYHNIILMLQKAGLAGALGRRGRWAPLKKSDPCGVAGLSKKVGGTDKIQSV
jgi:hypothetical protein